MATAPPAVGPESLVRFRELVIRPEADEVVVGRVETGEFVSLPPVGARAIELLSEGRRVAEAEAILRSELGEEVDLSEFVGELAEIGFVDSVDGSQLHGGEEIRPSLPWLEARHVAWLFGTPARVAYATVLAAAVVVSAARPSILPSYRDFFWSGSTSVVLAATTALFLTIVALHETAHLVAARSLGIPARISIGTRLHNLVAQTDLSGLWARPRRERFRGYLAGMLWDLFLGSVLLILLGTRTLPHAVDDVLSAVVALLLVGLLSQLQLYMRTDLYFVLSDAIGARNLFEDATVYLLGLVRRRSPGDEPLAALAPRERRFVKLYACFMLVGSLCALAAFAFFVVPFLAVLLARAAVDFVDGIADGDALRALDGGVTLAIEGGLQVLFLYVFARSRGVWLARLRGRFR